VHPGDVDRKRARGDKPYQQKYDENQRDAAPAAANTTADGVLTTKFNHGLLLEKRQNVCPNAD